MSSFSPIDLFHMTSHLSCLCPRRTKRRPRWCPKLILWEWNSFLMQRPFFYLNEFAYLLTTRVVFHMTFNVRRISCCPKTISRRPCWCSSHSCERNLFLMFNSFFYPNNLHSLISTYPREWRRSILSIVSKFSYSFFVNTVKPGLELLIEHIIC